MTATLTPYDELPAPERFAALAAAWKDETLALSSTHDIVMNASYQQIIGMGPEALPLILTALRDEPAYWFWALAAITGVDPARDTERFEDARIAWLHWGAKRGLVELPQQT